MSEIVRVQGETADQGAERVISFFFFFFWTRNCLPIPLSRGDGQSFALTPLTGAIAFVDGTAAAAAKSLQSCPTLCDPIDGSPPGSSLGFSRQEHWSGLPFPSSMPESEK